LRRPLYKRWRGNVRRKLLHEREIVFRPRRRRDEILLPGEHTSIHWLQERKWRRPQRNRVLLQHGSVQLCARSTATCYSVRSTRYERCSRPARQAAGLTRRVYVLLARSAAVVRFCAKILPLQSPKMRNKNIFFGQITANSLGGIFFGRTLYGPILLAFFKIRTLVRIY